MRQAMVVEQEFLGFAAADAAAADEGSRTFTRRISLQKVIATLVVVDLIFFVGLGFLPLVAPLLNSGQTLSEILTALSVRGEPIAVGLGLVFFFGMQRLLGGYRTKTVMRGGWSVRRGLMSAVVTFAMLIALAAAGKVTDNYSRVWFFTWMASTLTLLPFAHIVLVGRVRRSLAQGGYVYRALSIGLNCAPLKQSEVTRLTRGLSRPLSPVRIARVEDLAQIEYAIREQRLDEIYISTPWDLAPEVFRQVRQLDHLAAHIYVMPSDATLASQLVGARMRGEQLQLQIQDRPIDGWGHLQKRAFDVLVAGSMLLLLSPLMILVALLIKLESRGPVLFRQKREGFNGRAFEALKFRSMYHNMSDAGAVKQTSRGDKRVTYVGRFIRRSSIDELPQLLNVLRGDMSIVGPRPHALQTTAEGKALDEAVSDYAARHRVLPGITGLAQVSGVRGELDSIDKLRERVRYDIEYIENWSLWLDLEILLKTALLVIYDPKAY